MQARIGQSAYFSASRMSADDDMAIDDDDGQGGRSCGALMSAAPRRRISQTSTAGFRRARKSLLHGRTEGQRPQGAQLIRRDAASRARPQAPLRVVDTERRHYRLLPTPARFALPLRAEAAGLGAPNNGAPRRLRCASRSVATRQAFESSSKRRAPATRRGLDQACMPRRLVTEAAGHSPAAFTDHGHGHGLVVAIVVRASQSRPG